MFEAVSGFTTTGATVLSDVEVLSSPLQFWRCFSHWLGGMGIVLLGVAILPLVGHGGMHFYRAEFSGAKSEKLKPRITETALSLWRIYFSLSVLLFVALRFAGMNGFDAICHTFSTLGTGGFSTRTASIAGFESKTIEYLIILFMLLAGISFVQHYRLWVERRPRGFFGDVETRFYVLTIAVATVIIGTILILDKGYALEAAFRSALFQVTAITTGTGFVTDNFEIWHPLPQLMLLALMFVGGCTGSTTGGLKVSRLLLLAKVVDREFKRMVERRGVFAVRLGGDVIPEATIQSLLNLVYLAFVVNFVSCLLLAAMGVDVLTSIAAVAASMFNIGPGLGGVGPLDNYGHLPAMAKWGAQRMYDRRPPGVLHGASHPDAGVLAQIGLDFHLEPISVVHYRFKAEIVHCQEMNHHVFLKVLANSWHQWTWYFVFLTDRRADNAPSQCSAECTWFQFIVRWTDHEGLEKWCRAMRVIGVP